MSEQENLRAVAAKGDRARRFLEDETFRDAVKRVKERIYGDWCNTRPDDRNLREQLYAQGKALDGIVFELTKESDAGTVANAVLKQHERREQQKRGQGKG
jgi:hypothetical protein